MWISCDRAQSAQHRDRLPRCGLLFVTLDSSANPQEGPTLHRPRTPPGEKPAGVQTRANQRPHCRKPVFQFCLENICWRALVQRTHFPDSLSFWLNKMIIVFLLTSIGLKSSLPQEGASLRLTFRSPSSRPICPTAVTGEAAQPSPHGLRQ